MKDLTRALVALTVVGLAVGLAAAAGAGGAVAAGGEDVVTLGENQTVPNDTTTDDGSGTNESTTDDDSAANESTAKEAGNPLKWSTDAAEREVLTTPAVAEGVLYVGSLEGKLYAIDADDGESVWNVSTGKDHVVASPTVNGDAVYVGANDFNRTSGSVHRLNATSGDTEWSTRLKSVEGSPIVANGNVYVASLNNNEYYSTVHALNASTGVEQWNISVPNYALTTAPQLVNETLYVSGYNVDVDSDNHPVSSQVVAIDVRERAIDWTFNESNGRIRSAPTVVDGTVYVGSENATLYALDADDGTVSWQFETALRIRASPTVVNDTVFVGDLGLYIENDSTAGVYAVNATTGEELWSTNQTHSIGVAATIHGGTLFVGDQRGTDDENDTHVSSGRLYAFDLATGDLQWSFNGSDHWISTPLTVANDSVYFGNQNGSVYAVDATYQVDGGDEDEGDSSDGNGDGSSEDSDDSSGGGPSFGPAPSPPSQGDGDAPAAFDVDLAALSGGAVPGESADVAVTVTNTGDETGTAKFDVEVDGGVDETISVTLDGGEETTVTVSVTIPEVDSDVEIDARSSDGTIEASTTLGLAEPDLVIESADLPEEATPGEDVTVAATVANEGQIATDATVEYRVGGAVLATEDVTLEPGDSADVSLSATVPETLDDDASQSVRVGDAETESSLAAAAAGDSVPGFGVGAALVALSALAIAGYRRR